MAYLADSVVVDLIGNTRQLDGPVNDSARKFERNMSTIERSAVKAEKQIVSSSGRIANAQRNMGRQIADIGTQVAGGQSPFIILAQQLPQVADAATDMGGKLGRVASFLTSPWGAAALAATSVLVPLVAGLVKTGNETDNLVEKMRKQARQAEQTRQAEDAYRITLDGVTESIRKRREEQEKALQTDQQAEQAALGRARGELATQRSNLRDARQELVDAQKRLAEQQRNVSAAGPGASGAAAGSIAVFERRVEAARNKIRELEASVRQAEASARGAEIPISERNVESRVDAVAAATDRYTAALGRLRQEREAGRISQQQFEQQLEAARRRRDKDIETAQKARRSTGAVDADTTPFQRPVQGGTVRGSFAERRPGHRHAGTDIAVPVGTSVSAAAPGTVIESGTMPGYGNVVIIDHGRGTTTRYAHLSKLLAAKGDVVSAGQQIGLSGGAKGAPGAGNSQGPHLHYEVRRNGRAVDPGTGAFPIDPATARKANDNIRDDFDKLMDDLASEAERAREKITSDFTSLEDGLDPAAKSARELADQLQTIEDARLIGLIDDARALELRLAAVRKQMEPVVKRLEAIGRRTAKKVEEGQKQATDEAHDKAESQIYQLADLYESLFTGGTRNLWEEFKRQGLRALALLAAQKTFELITGKKAPSSGGDGGGDLLSSIIAGIGGIFGGGGKGSVKSAMSKAKVGLGRASGGYVGPHSVHRVNESSGGIELLRMGPQGGEIIPLGRTKAATPGGTNTSVYNISVSADNSVTPAGFAKGLAGQILAEARRMDANAARTTLRAVPARLSQYQNDGS